MPLSKQEGSHFRVQSNATAKSSPLRQNPADNRPDHKQENSQSSPNPKDALSMNSRRSENYKVVYQKSKGLDGGAYPKTMENTQRGFSFEKVKSGVFHIVDPKHKIEVEETPSVTRPWT